MKLKLRIRITGVVQGVGFRPFIFRLAKELGLKGYVLNDVEGVFVEAEGDKKKLDEFLIRIPKEKPDISQIFSLRHSFLHEPRIFSLQSWPDSGSHDFEIRESSDQGEKKVTLLPDISVCDECTAETTDPRNRRFLYLFTNCTNCGPRFTITKDFPYDRNNTSMKEFTMCSDCESEYNSSQDRRFHAQPNACHECGPWISIYDNDGSLQFSKYDALKITIDLIQKGAVIAIKGIGGFHLVCDATNEDAVNRLRKNKFREEKPMAVMFPDLEMIRTEAKLSKLEERAIDSIEKPIVIVTKSDTSAIADAVSPHNSTVGVFLPYTPLHHIMLQKLRKPVVATSANMTDEPIVKDEEDAFNRLSGIADNILSHNRGIVRRCDDSVVRIMADRQVPIRRSRGFVPLSVNIPFKLKNTVLALGPYMNNTIALGIEDRVYLSQHIGDLDTPLAMEFYEETVNDLLRLLGAKPDIVISDFHPGYYSTQFGEKNYADRLLKVQHHFAHILSCMAENDLPEGHRVIGCAFDGTGYGPDKTIWGSEVMTASYKDFKRAFHLLPYRLPGGDKAVKEPCRAALSLLYESFGDEAPDLDFKFMPDKERSFLLEMIKKEINSPLTTSMGRLFDGVASLIGLRHKVSYHAQAAIALEQAALRSGEAGSYPFSFEGNIIDFRPLIRAIVDDVKERTSIEKMAKKFHNSIVNIIINTSENLRADSGITTVALSGGVFQNAILLEETFSRLQESGFTPIIHQLVPPNDGGISLGQVVFGHFAK
jgi:hydrogenase maturation protein HypF